MGNRLHSSSTCTRTPLRSLPVLPALGKAAQDLNDEFTDPFKLRLPEAAAGVAGDPRRTPDVIIGFPDRTAQHSCCVNPAAHSGFNRGRPTYREIDN